MQAIDPINLYIRSGYANLGGNDNNEFWSKINLSEFENNSPFKVFEDNGNIRSCYGIHQIKSYLDLKPHLKKAEDTIREILQDDIYIHQSKINYKENLPTAVWPWHRDFPFWKNYDNIPESKMVNLIVFLDNVTLDSGPLQVIPQSHLHFFEDEKKDEKIEFNALSGSFSSDLDFELPPKKVEELAKSNGIVSLLGQVGDISFFHPDVIHQSSFGKDNNKRKLLILTYNACSNKPSTPSPRPVYFAFPVYSPI